LVNGAANGAVLFGRGAFHHQAADGATTITQNGNTEASLAEWSLFHRSLSYRSNADAAAEMPSPQAMLALPARQCEPDVQRA
jgi:hypothetical protein